MVEHSRRRPNTFVDASKSVICSVLCMLVLSTIQQTYYVVNGQGGEIIGTDICFCQPVTYKIRLDFALECPDSTVNNTIPGILEVSCLVESRNEEQNLTDPFPIIVNEVQILELDRNFELVGQTVYTDPLTNGSIVEYTSIVATSPDFITPETIPRAFQITIQALNSLEEPLTQTIAIEYSNNCGIFPLLTEGQQIGWAIFVSFSFNKCILFG